MKNISFTKDASQDLFEVIHILKEEEVCGVHFLKKSGFVGNTGVLELQQSSFDSPDSFSNMNIGGVEATTVLDEDSVQIERVDQLTTSYIAVKYTSNGSTGEFNLNVVIK